jgi:hypothetical protein
MNKTVEMVEWALSTIFDAHGRSRKVQGQEEEVR